MTAILFSTFKRSGRLRILSLIFLFFLFSSSIIAQPLVWAKKVGGAANDFAESMVLDVSGNVYLCGGFSGAADFDPGAGTTSLSPVGTTSDIFFAKYDANGGFIWAKKAGGSGNDYANCIAVDAAANVYVCGYFYSTVDFDPGVGITNLVSAGSADIFFAKYNSSGDLIWANRLGTSGLEEARSIAVDASGNVYVAGYFTSTTDFNPGIGIDTLINAGSQDIFLAKYDVSGNYLWAKSIGALGDDEPRSIKVDNSGNVYLTGWFEYNPDFDPGAGTAVMTSHGLNDVFIAKYSTDGNYIWSKNFGGNQHDEASAMVLDNSGNMLITGKFIGSVDFDAGPSTATHATSGGTDLFLVKYDTAGTFLWVNAIGGIASEEGSSVSVNTAGDAFVTGVFAATVDFDAGPKAALLSSVGSQDIYFAKYAANGDYKWARKIGGVLSNEFGGSIALNSSDGIFLSGMFNNTIDLNPGVDTLTVNSTGNYDFFFSRFLDCNLLAQPDSILGDTAICIGFSAHLSIAPVAGAIDYTWSLPGGWSGNSNGDTITVTSLGGLPSMGYVLVTANNNCGASQPQQLAISFDFCPGGVDQNTSISAFRIFPNPATDRIQLSHITGIFSLSVYSVLGEEMLSIPQTSFINTTQEIDISALPAGIYFVKISSGETALVRKLIKQ